MCFLLHPLEWEPHKAGISSVLFPHVSPCDHNALWSWLMNTCSLICCCYYNTEITDPAHGWLLWGRACRSVFKYFLCTSASPQTLGTSAALEPTPPFSLVPPCSSENWYVQWQEHGLSWLGASLLTDGLLWTCCISALGVNARLSISPGCCVCATRSCQSRASTTRGASVPISAHSPNPGEQRAQAVGGEAGSLRGHLRSRQVHPGHPGDRSDDSFSCASCLFIPLREQGISLHGRYLLFGAKGTSHEGREMNFSLKFSNEAWRISCPGLGHLTPGMTANPQSWQLPRPTDSALKLWAGIFFWTQISFLERKILEGHPSYWDQRGQVWGWGCTEAGARLAEAQGFPLSSQISPPGTPPQTLPNTMADLQKCTLLPSTKCNFFTLLWKKAERTVILLLKSTRQEQFIQFIKGSHFSHLNCLHRNSWQIQKSK